MTKPEAVVSSEPSPPPSGRGLLRFACILSCWGYLILFLSIALHECMGHGLFALLTGGDFTWFSVDLFDWSYARSEGQALHFYLEGIALQLLLGALSINWARQEKGPWLRMFLWMFGATNLLHSLLYMAHGSFRSVGDPALFYSLVGWGREAQVTVGLAALSLALVLGGWLARQLLEAASELVPLQRAWHRFLCALGPALAYLIPRGFVVSRKASSMEIFLLQVLGLWILLMLLALKLQPRSPASYAPAPPRLFVGSVFLGMLSVALSVFWTSKGIAIPWSPAIQKRRGLQRQLQRLQRAGCEPKSLVAFLALHVELKPRQRGRSRRALIALGACVLRPAWRALHRTALGDPQAKDALLDVLTAILARHPKRQAFWRPHLAKVLLALRAPYPRFQGLAYWKRIGGEPWLYGKHLQHPHPRLRRQAVRLLAQTLGMPEATLQRMEPACLARLWKQRQSARRSLTLDDLRLCPQIHK